MTDPTGPAMLIVSGRPALDDNGGTMSQDQLDALIARLASDAAFASALDAATTPEDAQRIAAENAKKAEEARTTRNRFIWGVIAVVVVIFLFARNGSNTPSRSSPTYSPPAQSGQSGQTYRVPRSQSSSLANEKQQLANERAAVEQLDRQVANLAAEIERERRFLNTNSEYAVDAFNAKVAGYNALLETARRRNADFNAGVAAYNAKLQRYGR